MVTTHVNSISEYATAWTGGTIGHIPAVKSAGRCQSCHMVRLYLTADGTTPEIRLDGKAQYNITLISHFDQSASL